MYLVNMGLAPSPIVDTTPLVVNCSNCLVVSNLRFLGFFSTEARKSRSCRSKEKVVREVLVGSKWNNKVSLRPEEAKWQDGREVKRPKSGIESWYKELAAHFKSKVGLLIVAY